MSNRVSGGGLEGALDLIPAQGQVVASRALQSLATPIVALLVSTAMTLGGEIEDAISFCNVLFVGNLCAALVVLTSFGPRNLLRDLRGMGRRLWVEALLFGALAALLSALIFTALETTSVTNVVLLARLGPVFYVIAGAMLLGFAVTRSEWLGFALIAVGVTATVLAGSGFMIALGDLLILASSLVYAAVTVMGKRLMPETGLGALMFVRNFLSAVVFFIIATVWWGPEHFSDAFYGPLWAIMVVYALIVIVAAQLLWYRGVAKLTPASIARWTVMTPALAVGFAYIINGEEPSWVQLTALGFITAGIVVSSLGKRTPKGQPENAEQSVAAS
jgi:drug/metabolite transporter (DMT)-like permease